MPQLLDRLTAWGERRPRLTLMLFAVLALACAGVSLSLAPSTSVNTLVSASSADSQATLHDEQQFGGAAVVVLVREPLQQLIGSRDLGVLSELEACLAGEQVDASASAGAFVPVPAGHGTPYGGASSPCGALMRHRPADTVYGPATFLNQAVIAVNQQIRSLYASDTAAISRAESAAAAAAKAKGESPTAQRSAATAAGSAATQQVYSQVEQLALSSGLSDLTSAPSIDNTSFIESIVFDSTRGAYTPKARFAYLFPTSDSALIQVRLRADLSPAQTAAAIRWIRAATQMPMFRLSAGSYLVSGEPVVLNDVSASLSGQVLRLLIGAVLVMAVVLLLVFRQRRRLLPLGLALGAAAITFGLCALAGGTLTLASIAVLPILIGLAVDYGIQFQSRASGAPTIAAAALATATGFLVLLLSPVPMVRGFGLLLVLGVAVAFLIVLCAGAAALRLSGPRWPDSLAASGRGAAELLLVSPRWLRREIAPSLRGAGEIIAQTGPRRQGGPASRRDRRSSRIGLPHGLAGGLAALAARPRAVLALGLVLAVAGWIADTQTAVQSDITKLVPANLPALANLRTLEQVTHESGELDVLVHAPDVATPATVAWMESYEQQIVTHFGYVEERGCAAATVCPALSLPDLFSGAAGSGSAGSGSAGASSAGSAGLTQAGITTLLDAVPAYFSRAVINARRTYAALAFGIRLMPLAEQIRVVDYLRDHLHPPAGVTAQVAGLPVLAADADASLSSASRRLLTLLAGLFAVGLMLLAIFRDARRVLVPLAPIVLATGWSALVVWIIGIPLNPMSATLGALVIAISTEFSVLLAERFRRQREAGESVEVAVISAYRSTGKAVLASGITAIAGFAVLIVSDVTMLSDFGLVTLIDMTVSLLGVLAVLPAVLALSEATAPSTGRGIRWARRRRTVSGRSRARRVRRGPDRPQVPA